MLDSQFDETKILFLLDNKVREDVNLDYKSIKALDKTSLTINGISKDVSAFANSAGGNIIYGIEDDKHIPISIDGTSEIGDKKEWLEQIINSNIQPRIEGITVYLLLFKSQPEKGVLIVNIPMSNTAHQANDRKYYHRYGSESQPMEDYQVKQTMNRGREPLLKLEVPPDCQIFPRKQPQIRIHLILRNYGRISANFPEIFIHIPREIIGTHEGEWEERLLMSGISVPLRVGFRQYYFNWEKSFKRQVHPGLGYEISSDRDRAIAIFSPQGFSEAKFILKGYYEIYAENMKPQHGIINFDFTRDVLTISINEIVSL